MENSKNVGQCRIPFGELQKAVITMHVVVQPSVAKSKTGISTEHFGFFHFAFHNILFVPKEIKFSYISDVHPSAVVYGC